MSADSSGPVSSAVAPDAASLRLCFSSFARTKIGSSACDGYWRRSARTVRVQSRSVARATTTERIDRLSSVMNACEGVEVRRVRADGAARAAGRDNGGGWVARLQHVWPARISIKHRKPLVSRLGHAVRVHVECLVTNKFGREKVAHRLADAAEATDEHVVARLGLLAREHE